MTLTLSEFIAAMADNPILTITVLLNLAVILVNGWTDAPNAIATCVSTRSMTPKKAIAMAAVFNFFGVCLMTLINATVATTIYRMVDFGGNSQDALIAVCAAMFAIVIWATAAWYFGIPTSESHALIAGITGAAIALQGGMSGVNGAEWIKVIYGLGLSTLLGFGLGFVIARGMNYFSRNLDFQKGQANFGRGQVAAAAGMAFMHGAQDGQKFMGIFFLTIILASGQSTGGEVELPLWMMIVCSLVMALGTSIGGMRIIKSVGMKMVHLTKQQGFSSDMAAVVCLFLSSWFGIPVSTTHTKTTSIMGVGAAKRLSAVNWGVVKEMVLTWLLTFPGCGLIGFLMAKVFLAVF
ncbi:MAG: inorganic phosphate transporter [Bacillota bacterium]|nr:inorganic phosphate transporter [Bacillota bacterium]